jgi:hypothetical protein
MGNYPDTKRKHEDSTLEEIQEQSVVELPKKYVHFVRFMLSIFVVNNTISLGKVALPDLGEIF